MTDVAMNEAAPAFETINQVEETVSLEQFRGKNVVLYFYPKDDTPGCTTEAKDFTEHMAAFEEANTVILGVSKDSTAAHCKFINKHGLSVTLLSDEDGSVCEAYGVWVEKNMYGKKYMGIQRDTFLIDGEGVVRQIWRKVKVKDHAVKVLEAVRALNAEGSAKAS